MAFSLGKKAKNLDIQNAAAAQSSSMPAAAAGMMGMQRVSARMEQVDPKIKATIVVFWLLVWEAADRIIDNRLILAGPICTVQTLIEQALQANFWITCGTSFLRLAAGFLIAFAASVLLAVFAYRCKYLRWFVDPIISVLKTIPMISFVIMMLIWVGNQLLTIFLALLIVLPFIYTAVISGLESTSDEMLEMAETFQLSRWKKFMYIYRPALMPYLLSSCKVACGMSWKTGIMAEVIGTPKPSIGHEMYIAKQYLSTPELFAWTAVVILLSLAFEHFFMWLLKKAALPMGERIGKKD